MHYCHYLLFYFFHVSVIGLFDSGAIVLDNIVKAVAWNEVDLEWIIMYYWEPETLL